MGAGRLSAAPGRLIRRAPIGACLAVVLAAVGGCSPSEPTNGSVLAEASPHTLRPSRDAPVSPTPSAAAACLAAVDAATPAWQDVDAMLTARNSAVCRDDPLTQVDADAPFVAALLAIEFPPEAAPAANDLVAAVLAYDAFLTTEYENFGTYGWYISDGEQLRPTRAESSGHLRDVLGLPASTAAYRRP